MFSLNDFSPISQISTATLTQNKREDKLKDILWTTDIKKELPVFFSTNVSGNMPARTMIDIFEETCNTDPKAEALFVERNGQWISWTWNHYYKEATNFARALIYLGVEPYRTVNILGANSPEWVAAYFGGIYACVVPSGVYNSNNSETCVYIAEHSECGCLVLDSIDQFRKYEKDLQKLKLLKAIVFYCELTPEENKALINPYVSIFQWKDFIDLGKKANNDLEFNNRIRMQNVGNCATIVYTSGTTGPPKAVLLSHDNLTWTGRTMLLNYSYIMAGPHRVVSYLPLSHIAGTINDIICKNILFIF